MVIIVKLLMSYLYPSIICPISTDAAGMVTCEDGHLSLRKDNGLVSEVFHQHHMVRLRVCLGFAHEATAFMA